MLTFQQNHIKKEVAEKLNVELCFTRQKREDLIEIIESVRSE